MIIHPVDALQTSAICQVAQNTTAMDKIFHDTHFWSHSNVSQIMSFSFANYMWSDHFPLNKIK